MINIQVLRQYVLEVQEKIMKEMISSDNFNPEMLAAQAFDIILNGINRSNLNFQLQVSPFSLQISLKKSKDRCGNFIPPCQLQVTAS